MYRIWGYLYEFDLIDIKELDLQTLYEQTKDLLLKVKDPVYVIFMYKYLEKNFTDVNKLLAKNEPNPNISLKSKKYLELNKEDEETELIVTNAFTKKQFEIEAFDYEHRKHQPYVKKRFRKLYIDWDDKSFYAIGRRMKYTIYNIKTQSRLFKVKFNKTSAVHNIDIKKNRSDYQLDIGSGSIKIYDYKLGQDECSYIFSEFLGKKDKYAGICQVNIFSDNEDLYELTLLMAVLEVISLRTINKEIDAENELNRLLLMSVWV